MNLNLNKMYAFRENLYDKNSSLSLQPNFDHYHYPNNSKIAFVCNILNKKNVDSSENQNAMLVQSSRVHILKSPDLLKIHAISKSPNLKIENKTVDKTSSEDNKIYINKCPDDQSIVLATEQGLPEKSIGTTIRNLSDLKLIPSSTNIYLFKFDKIIEGDLSDTNIGQSILVKSVKEAFKGISMAYFRFGPSEVEKKEKGKISSTNNITSFTIDEIYKVIEANIDSKNSSKIFLKGSYFIIYGNQIIDLMDGKAKKIIKNSNKSIKIDGLTRAQLKGKYDFQSFLFHSEKVLKILENEELDPEFRFKVHFVFILSIIKKNQSEKSCSQLAFIDLASSDFVASQIKNSYKQSKNIKLSKSFNAITKFCLTFTKGIKTNDLINNNLLLSSISRILNSNFRIIINCIVSPFKEKIIHCLPALKFCTNLRDNIVTYLFKRKRELSFENEHIYKEDNTNFRDSNIDNNDNEYNPIFKNFKNKFNEFFRKYLIYSESGTSNDLKKNLQANEFQDEIRDLLDEAAHLILNQINITEVQAIKDELFNILKGLRSENTVEEKMDSNFDLKITERNNNENKLGHSKQGLLINDQKEEITTNYEINSLGKKSHINSEKSFSQVTKDQQVAGFNSGHLLHIETLFNEMINERQGNVLLDNYKNLEFLGQTLIKKMSNIASSNKANIYEEFNKYLQSNRELYISILSEIASENRFKEEANKKALSSLESEIKELHYQLFQGNKNDYEEQKELYQKSLNEIDHLKSLNKKEQEDRNLFEASLSRTEEENKALNKKLKEKNEIIANLKLSNTTLQNENSELKYKLSTENKLAYQTIEESKKLKKRTQQFEKEIEEKYLLIKESEMKNKELKNSIENLEQENKELNFRVQGLESNSNIIESRKNLNALTNENAILKQENNKISLLIEEMKRNISSSNMKIETFNNEINHYKMKIKELEKLELEKEKDMFKKLNEQETSFSSLQKRVIEYESELANERKIKNEYNSKLDILTSENLALKSENMKIKDERKKAELDVQCQYKTYMDQSTVLEQQIRNIELNMELKEKESKKIKEGEAEIKRKLQETEEQLAKYKSKCHKLKKERKSMRNKFNEVFLTRLTKIN